MKPLLAAVIAVVAAAAVALGHAIARDGDTPITSDDGVKALVVPVGSSHRVGSSQVCIKVTTVTGATLAATVVVVLGIGACSVTQEIQEPTSTAGASASQWLERAKEGGASGEQLAILAKGAVSSADAGSRGPESGAAGRLR